MNNDNNDTTEMQTLNAQVQIRKWLIGALLVLLAVVAVVFMASRSLPGDALYGIKTSFLEQFNQSVQFGPKSVAEYQVSRMESRLDELKALAQRQNVSQENLDTLKQMIQSHAVEIEAAIASTDESFGYGDRLLTLNKFAAVAAAMEEISENTVSLQGISEEIEDVRRDAVNLYQEQVDRFVERETSDNVFQYVKDRLTDVSNELGSGTLQEKTIDDAEVYIERVGPAMAEGDFPRAISAIAEALRFIMIDKYGAVTAQETMQAQEEETVQEDAQSTSSLQEDAEVPEESSSFSFPQ